MCPRPCSSCARAPWRSVVSYETVRQALEKVIHVSLLLPLAEREADAGRLSDAVEDVVGALEDLAPELRALRQARRRGIARTARTA